MAINIDKNKARAILLKANEQKSFANDSIGESIKDILSGTHKTYKYLLVNALLAKSVSQRSIPSACKLAMILKEHTTQEAFVIKYSFHLSVNFIPEVWEDPTSRS